MSEGLTGADRIVVERQRQKSEKGYTVARDGTRVDQLVAAAQCYISLFHVMSNFKLGEDVDVTKLPAPNAWPWRKSDWHPEADRNQNLVKAGALLAAAIDAGGIHEGSKSNPDQGKQ